MKALLGAGATLLACALVAQCQTGTPPFLFFATEAEVLKAQQVPLVESSGFEQWRVVQQLNITGVNALDVDIFEGKLYWINSVEKRIYRLSVGESESESECIVCCCLSSPEDLAVDWLGRNLYWTDSDLHTIEIAKLDGSERTTFATIPKEMGSPSLVKVDPIRGDLYWSPKSGSVIYQMRMDDLSDDSNPRISVFWQDPSNQTVVGIAVNYSTSGGNDYIYWAVSGQHVTRRFKKPLGANQDSNLDSHSDFNVLDMEILGDHIYYIHDGIFTDQIRNDDTQADLLYSAVYGETSFTDMVFLDHSHQPVPPPSVEITSEDTPVNNRPYTATCVATFPVPVPLGSVIIEATDIYGINLTLSDRITFSSIRQIDERTFARDLTVNPITFFDSGTYVCSASLRNNFIISHPDSAYINVTVLDAPLPAPEVIGLCTNVVWYVPAVSCEGIQGYNVRLFQPQSAAQPNVTRRVGSNATFYILQDHHQMGRSRDGLYVQVRVIHSNGVGEWSEGTSIGCESPTPTPTPETPSVYFEINGEIYFNNSAIPISEIGEGDNAIYCRTDKVDCCGTRPNRFGEFYYPNGVKVPVNAQRHGFYRNRGEQIVRLNRREGVSSPTGTYRCEVPNADGDTVKIYITLVSLSS